MGWQPRTQAPSKNLGDVGGGGAFWTIPKTLVIWASSSHITLAIWVTVRIRVRVTRDAHITRILVMGMPISLWQRAPLPFPKEKTLGWGYRVAWGGGGVSSEELIRRLQPHVYMRLFLWPQFFPLNKLYLVDNSIGFLNTSPLDGDLSGG